MEEPINELTTFAIPLKAAKIPNEVVQKKEGVEANYDYIPFGSDNLFPQVWELQMRNSVVSRSILKDKVNFTMGDGLEFADNVKLENYILEVNSKGESLEHVLSLIYKDKYSGGNGYVELVKHKGFLSIFHLDWTRCRYKKDAQGIISHPDWYDYDNTKDSSTIYPLYPNFGVVKSNQKTGAEDLLGERCILHLKNYESEFNYYGLPDAIAAKNAIAIGYSTTSWNKSRIENGMNVSAMLLISGQYNPDQAKKLKDSVEASFTGEDNQGKIMAIVKESGTDGRTENTELVQVGTPSDGDWKNLSDEAKGEVLMAFNWKRTLTNFDDSTGMNNSDKILNDFYIVLQNVIKPEQRIVLEKLKQVIKIHSGIDTKNLYHLNKSPLPLFMILKDINSAFKIGEVRESAGYDYDENDETHKQYLNSKANGTNNSI